MTDEIKPVPFAIVLRSTVNPQAQVIVKHYAFNKDEVWAALSAGKRFAGRTEAGEVDVVVDLTQTIANVMAWEAFEELARQPQLVAPTPAVLIPRGRG